MMNDPYNLNDMTITLGGGATGSYTVTAAASAPVYTIGTYPNTATTYNWPAITTGTGTDTIANIGPYWGTSNSGLKVIGDAEFDGDVKIKGKSIVDSLEKIEEKLAILRPNEELEAKWNKLRELRNAYMELEKEILKKEKMWGILKK